MKRRGDISTQAYISRVLGITGLLAGCFALISQVARTGDIRAVIMPNVLPVFILSGFMLLTGKGKASRIIQTLLIAAVGTVSILDSYDSAYGLLFLTVGYLLSFIYGLLSEKRARVVFGLYAVVVVEVSAFLNLRSYHGFTKGLSVLLFILMISFIIRKIALEILDGQIRARELLTAEERLEQVREENNYLLALLEEKKLSPREQEIAIGAYRNREGQKLLAQSMNIAPGTIGAHLHSVYDKLGIDTVQELKEYLSESLRRRETL